MALAVSPLAPDSLAYLPPVKGITLASGAFGLRYKDRPDLLLISMAASTVVAGVFTVSTTAAAPVQWCRKALAAFATGTAPCALLVNAGQANAFTGQHGEQAVQETVSAVAKLLGCGKEHVFVSSTGVIGQPLPVEKINAALPQLASSLQEEGWSQAADAIRTTDTYAKRLTRSVTIQGKAIVINGIAKGSGMIAPNMATMLAYMFTDAAVAPDVWQTLLEETNARSFNCITVDSDTSTNDTFLAFATGQAGNETITNLHDPDFHEFREAFRDLAVELAQLVVKDGEGAQKFITVHVSGAHTHQSAHTMAMAIANSPLIKTAIAGEDANWGRVVMAIGKTGEPVKQEEISIAFGDYIIARDGAVVPGYDERPVAEYMKSHAIDITVSVGKGFGEAKVWTCDLTHGYIAINADYRS